MVIRMKSGSKILLLSVALLILLSGCGKKNLVSAYKNFDSRLFVCGDGNVFSRSSHPDLEDTVKVPEHPVISGYITDFVDSTSSDFYMEDGICNWISPIPGRGTPFIFLNEETVAVLDTGGYWWIFTYECPASDFKW